jgi:hypothetical protein
MRHGCSLVVCAVVPPKNSCYNLHGDSNDPYFPSVSLRERVGYTEELNRCLAKYALENGLLFLDPFKPYKNPDGSLNNAYADGIHIKVSCNRYIRNSLIAVLASEKDSNI